MNGLPRGFPKGNEASGKAVNLWLRRMAKIHIYIYEWNVDRDIEVVRELGV